MLLQRPDGIIVIAYLLARGVIALLLLTSIVKAQSVDTIKSEADLASMLCRDATAATTDELLNKNVALVNVTLWNTLLNCASSDLYQQSPARRVEIFKLTLRVAERISKPELAATTYYYLGRTYSGVSDFENSIQAYERSRELFEQAGAESSLGYVLADLGALYFAAEDFEKARSYSEQSLNIARQTVPNSVKESLERIEYSRARALHTLGEIDLRVGNHEGAIKKLVEALAIYERLNGSVSSYNKQIAAVFIAQAEVYGETGQYGRAFSYLTKAHQVSRSLDDQNTSAKIMSTQAVLFLEQGDYAAAQKYLNASLEIYKSLRNAREEARVLLNLAVIEQRQGHHEVALQLFQQTMEWANSAKSVGLQIGAGQRLGVVLTAKRDFLNALRAINQSLELARRSNAKAREVELLCLTAHTYYAMQNYGESAAVAEQALALARLLRLPKLTYMAAAALGEAYAADEKQELAITILKDAVAQTEELRDEVVGRQDGRHLFFENKVGPYHTLVKLLTKQGKNFEALGYAERARSRVLLEAVRNNRTDLKDIYTASEKADAEFLINKLHGINQRIQSQTGDGQARDELQNELKGVQGELVLFQERLAAAHPELLLRAGPARNLTQASLNNLVRASDLAYLEYVVTGDKVGIFILKRNGLNPPELKYVDLPVNVDKLRRKVNDFHSALAERHPDYDALGRELYRLLIAPVTHELKDIQTVCIIPDDFLWALPFQALTTPRNSFLVQEYSLYYAPSLTVLEEISLRKRQQTSKESLLAFANPVLRSNPELKQALHPLPEAEAEVAAVATAVQTQMTKVVVGSQADEKTFKALAPQYATIHLATHGILNNSEPLNSYLVLTGTDGDPDNDGRLQAREIIDMHLDADLAVLSACETGNGRISPGEGVIGMSWAFFVGGARSVLVSQWRVNSGSTSQLMKGFYQVLARQDGSTGRNKSEALREASLSLLKDRRYRHPFYWAGFVLVSGN